MIRFMLGGIVIAFILVMVIGGLTGRVKAQNCCSVSPPEQDARMGPGDVDNDGVV